MSHTITRRGLSALALAALAALSATAPAADEKKVSPPKGAEVFVHPEKLTAKDALSFGEKGEKFEINGETTLIWVDLMPGARYGHETECVLISAAGTRVVKGDRWLVLNGKALFRDGKTYKAEFPAKLGGK